MLQRALLREHRLAGNAIDGVDLDAALLHEGAEDVEHEEALAFLRVARCGRKEQDGRAVRPPPNDVDVALDTT